MSETGRRPVELFLFTSLCRGEKLPLDFVVLAYFWLWSTCAARYFFEVGEDCGYFPSTITTHPLLQKWDTCPVEDRGGEHSAGPRRSITLHNTWQQLPKVEPSFWQLVLLLEMSQSWELENDLERFLQKFCFAPITWGEQELPSDC